MNTRVRVIFYGMMIVLLALISAFSVIPARADDGAPPPPAAPATDTAPAQTSTVDSSSNDAVPTDAAPAAPASDVAPADAAPTDVAPADAAPTDIAPTDAAPTDAAPTDAAPATDTAVNLSQVPAGTDVVVVNAAGDSVPLVSQEAADIISNGDPMWCPTGSTPGAATCTGATYFKDLLSSISGKTVPGTIWIAASYSSSGESGSVTLDGAPLATDTLGTTANFALTLNGGWNGVLGSTTITGTSTFNVPLSIINWNADVTLNNIVITGVTDAGSTALTVTTTKNINLTGVNVHDNAGGGAYLNNTSGPKSGTTDKVTITSSQFNGNDSDGLEVFSWGAITVNSLTAGSNNGRGAVLDNCSYPAASTCNATSVQPITLTGNNTFTGNWFSGLEVYSLGAITTNNLTADNNGTLSTGTSGPYRGGVGAWLENDYTGAPAVTLTGTNEFIGNYAAYWDSVNSVYDPHAGLSINSKGAITISNLTANGNTHGYGAYLDNCFYNGPSESCTNLTPSTITITGTNNFISNGYDGLRVWSGGIITVNNVTASSNGADASRSGPDDPLDPNLILAVDGTGKGVYLNNWGSLTAKAITLNTLSAIGNADAGLFIETWGALIASSITANNNGHDCTAEVLSWVCDGMNVDDSGSFTLTGSNNTFNSNGYDGLYTWSHGAVSLSNVHADGNVDWGTGIDSSGNNTTLLGVNTFTNNGYTGLEIFDSGAITLNNITATNNGTAHDPNDNQGVFLDTCNGSSACTTTAKPVSLLGNNTFGNNYGNGLEVNGSGAITLNNVIANNNGGDGALLKNDFSNASGAVSVNNTAAYSPSFSSNGDTGLVIYSRGAITLMDLDAENNGHNNFDAADHGDPINDSVGYGVYLDNSLGTGIVMVGTARAHWCNSMSDNFQSGLEVHSKGAVTLSNMCNDGNGGYTGASTGFDDSVDSGYGAHVDNSGGSSTPVSLTGSNEFDGNYDAGLYIFSKGIITTSNLTSTSSKVSWGAYLENDSGTTSGIIVNGANFFAGNWFDGLAIFSHGAITVNSVTSTGNGLSGFSDTYGIDAENMGASSAQPFTMTGINTLSGNLGGGGLFVKSKGAITINNLTANSNMKGYGASIDNSNGSASVTLNGTNEFNDNYDTGLYMLSKGAITINGTTANHNGQSGNLSGYGAYLSNQFPGSTQPIIVNGGLFTNNYSTPDLNPLTNGTFMHVVAPTWCPTGINPGGAGCHSYPTLQDLVAAVGLGGFQPTGGVIWIQNTTFGSDGPILFDGNTSGPTSIYWTAWSNTVLTIRGGWSGPGATISSAPSTLQDPLSILNWHADVTLSDIEITGVKDTSSTALKITTTKNITLTRVSVHDNTGKGADLENNGTGGTGAVVVSSSSFWNNTGGDGLDVLSKGAITLTNIVSNGNGAKGALLNNSTGSDMPVTLSGTTLAFSYNTENGLSVFSKGLITITDIDVIGNGCSDPNNELTCFNGLWLDNRAGTAGINLKGANVIAENQYGGLVAFSHGSVAINNLIADSNGNGSGAYIDNCDWNSSDPNPDNWHCTNPTAVPVTFTGTNEFKSNARGLHIYSNGVISLNNVTATNNFSLGDETGGAYLRNNFAFASNVTLTGTNNFEDNARTGLTVLSKGAISFSNINASGNGHGEDPSALPKPILPFGYGAYLDNTFGVSKAVILSVSGSNPDSVFDNNYSGGLVVYSLGAINLTGIDASNNDDGYGAYLKNDYSNAVGGITISGWGGAFGNNGKDLQSYGLEAYSRGAITATGLWAWNNGLGGAFIDNHLGTAVVTLGTLSGTSYSSNGWDGLDVISRGAITLNNAEADNNGQDNFGNLKLDLSADINQFETGVGIYLHNSNALTPQAVVLTGASNFDGNFDVNLNVYSEGAITANNLTSNNSYRGMGVRLDNTPSGHLAPQNVTLTGTNQFNNNFYSGLGVHTYGAVTLNNLDAENNGGDNSVDEPYGIGVFVDNGCVELVSGHGCTATLPKAVMLNGNNNFNSDYNGGLEVYSLGAITVNNLTAQWSGMGAYLDNTFGGPSVQQNVSITGFSDVENNYYDGLTVYSYGAITLTNLRADTNGQRGGSGDGIYLDNSEDANATPATAPKTVTINGYSNTYNNFDYGLEIHSLGAITVANLDASNSNGNGALLDNDHPKAVGGVTITGGAFTSNNVGNGLQITSLGAITFTINDSWTGSNTGYGWSLDNSSSPTKAGVTLTVSANNNIDFGDNGSFGLWVQSLGNISITNLDSAGNGGKVGGWGARLDNSFPNAIGTVTLATPATDDNSFGRNNGDGLDIFSSHAITVSNLNVDSNYGGAGVVLNNASSGFGSPQNVTVIGFGNSNNNGNDGLDVYSYGVIALININASNNGQNNFYILAHTGTIDPDNGWGVYLDNCNISISGCDSITPKGITLTGSNTFNGNFQDGLWATSLGPISATQLRADNNGGDGVYLDNQWSGGVGGITVTSATATSWNSFGNNGQGYMNAWPSGWNASSWTSGDGLEVNSNGAITLNDIQANGNYGYGSWVDTADHTNPYAAGAQNVTLTGRNSFINNGYDGLDVFADGNITINNLTANSNWGDKGAWLDNCLYDGSVCTGHGNITLTGTNIFNGNKSGDGLYVDSHGNIILNNVTADNNWLRGVYGGADGTILVSCGSMNNNRSYGWEFQSWLTVTLKGVFAYGNNGGGFVNTYLGNGTLVTSRSCP